MGVVFALGSMGLFGCTSARNALGTNSSPCYLALPVAKEAIHDRGTFAGVRLVTAKALAARLHLLAALTARARGKLTDVCVVEYRGSYRPDQVSRPLGHAPAGGVGRFAIVVVERSTNQLLATIVRSREPEPFRHTALRAAPRAGPDLVAAQGSPGAGPLP
ncbi:MAG TPA: hypothetical protein VMR97_01505 [Acidimicrobiales bacterium]|nr:hypothetical protein [Acidimicrobiales bacterium]